MHIFVYTFSNKKIVSRYIVRLLKNVVSGRDFDLKLVLEAGKSLEIT